VDGSDRFLLASTWTDEDSIARTVGARPIERPSSVDVLAGVAVIEHVQHYDLLEPVHRGILDAPGAVLRETTATVRPGRLDALLAWMRGKDREINASRIVLGWMIGHRQSDGGEVVAAVSAWASRLQIEAIAEAGRPADGPLFAALDEFVTDISVGTYQAIELRLPAALADVGGRRLIAARFAAAAAADQARQALEDRFASAREAGVYVARLGGSSAHEEQLVLVARVTLADHANAQRLIFDLGGQVLYETDELRASGGPGVQSELLGGAQPL